MYDDDGPKPSGATARTAGGGPASGAPVAGTTKSPEPVRGASVHDASLGGEPDAGEPVETSYADDAILGEEPAASAPAELGTPYAETNLSASATSTEPHFEEGLVDEVSHLLEDGISYAKAEAAFQKTRATLVGKLLGMAAGFGVVALVVANIALIALAIGLIMALAPLITIWGAVAVVVLLLLAITAVLALQAKSRVDKAMTLFGNDGSGS